MVRYTVTSMTSHHVLFTAWWRTTGELFEKLKDTTINKNKSPCLALRSLAISISKRFNKHSLRNK